MPKIGTKPHNVYHVGDYRDFTPTSDTSLMIADPVYGTGMVNDIIELAYSQDMPAIVFSAFDDLYGLERKPDQTLLWIKQPSTKNTAKRYSCFVEPITLWNGVEFYGKSHWSCRTGLFFDSLIENNSHQWKKPESLIEKLLYNHYPGKGVVYDPCAGSGTVHTVCKRMGIPSFSVEKDPKYQKALR